MRDGMCTPRGIKVPRMVADLGVLNILSGKTVMLYYFWMAYTGKWVIISNTRIHLGVYL